MRKENISFIGNNCRYSHFLNANQDIAMREIVQQARQEIERDIWQNRGGGRLFAELKRLEEEVNEKTTALRETLRMIEGSKGGETGEKSVDRLLDSIPGLRKESD